MSELKQKTFFRVLNEAFANGVSAVVDVAGNCYDAAKDVIHKTDYELRVLRVTKIAAQVALTGNITGVAGLYKILFPISAKGMRINYGDSCNEKCPTHGCHTFRTYENPKMAWCPLCMRFLQKIRFIIDIINCIYQNYGNKCILLFKMRQIYKTL